MARVTASAPFGLPWVTEPVCAHASEHGCGSGLEGSVGPRTWTELLYAPSLNQSILTFNLGLWFGLGPEKPVHALTTLIGWIASGRFSLQRFTPFHSPRPQPLTTSCRAETAAARLF